MTSNDWSKPDLNTDKTNQPGIIRGLVQAAASLAYGSDTNLPDGVIQLANSQLSRKVSGIFKDAGHLIIPGLTSAGSAGAFNLTPTIPLASYATDQVVAFITHQGCNGASTINISGLGNVNLKKQYGGSGAIPTLNNDFGANTFIVAVNDGTQFVIVSELPQSWNSYNPTLTVTAGGGSLSGQTINYSQFSSRGKWCKWILNESFIVTGTVNTIKISLPIACADFNGIFAPAQTIATVVQPLKILGVSGDTSSCQITVASFATGSNSILFTLDYQMA